MSADVRQWWSSLAPLGLGRIEDAVPGLPLADHFEQTLSAELAACCGSEPRGDGFVPCSIAHRFAGAASNEAASRVILIRQCYERISPRQNGLWWAVTLTQRCAKKVKGQR